ncbi:MAG: hypothetical protein M1496_05010 [Candidatus Thermoplasmatota archaeon]|nr:hypothetical protein [Candidatus Thermoplasmatota archaeon]
MKRGHILIITSDLLYLVSIILLNYSGDFVFSHGSEELTFLFLMIIMMMPILEIFSEKIHEILSGYFISVFLIADTLTIFLDFSNLSIMILQILAFILGFRYIMETNKRKFYRIAYVTYGVIMLFIASLLRYDPIQKINDVLVANISDDVRLSGIPIFFRDGIVIFSQRFFVLSISFQFLIIILLLGFLLMENSRKIIEIAGRSRGKTGEAFGLASMSFSVLSCQCETTTSIIPAIGAEILGVISVPVILESLILSLLTFIYIEILEKRGNTGLFEYLWNSNHITRIKLTASVLGILFIPVFITLGTSFNLESNLFFYFGTSIGVFVVSTYIFLNVMQFLTVGLKPGKIVMSLLIIAMLFLMVIWYWPAVLVMTVGSGILFSIMGVTSILTGFIFSVILTGLDRIDRVIAFEYAAGMFPVIFVLALYYSVVTESVIWPIYSLASQEIFSLVLLGISLPFMWLATNYSIYANFPRNDQSVNIPR